MSPRNSIKTCMRACVCVLIEVASHIERTEQLASEVREQAVSHRVTLWTMIDLASKIAASRASLLSGLKDAKHVFGQLEPVADDSLSMQDRRDALEVFVQLCHSRECVPMCSAVILAFCSFNTFNCWLIITANNLCCCGIILCQARHYY